MLNTSLVFVVGGSQQTANRDAQFIHYFRTSLIDYHFYFIQLSTMFTMSSQSLLRCSNLPCISAPHPQACTPYPHRTMGWVADQQKKSAHRKDNMDKRHRLVYLSSNQNLFRCFYGAAAITLPTVWYKVLGQLLKPNDILWNEDVLIVNIIATLLTGVAFAILPGTQRIVHRLYYDQSNDTFTAVHYLIPFRKQYLTFKPSEATHLNNSARLLKDYNGNFEVQGRKLMIDAEEFIAPQFYTILKRGAMH